MAKGAITAICALAALASVTAAPVGPVIGIVTQDLEGGDKTYIAASYIKYIESAGGRVIPLRYDYPLDKLTDLFGKINGILFPGGGADITHLQSKYMVAVQHLWSLALAANDNGDFFPVWGTCLGFETISILAAKEPLVLSSGFDSEDLPLALTLTPAATSSTLLGSAPADIIADLTQYNTTMNNHVAGVTPATFAQNSNLAAFYNVLSTNVDRKGKVFGSTIEGKKYPVWGTQWHPEKNAFEFTDREAIPHSEQAVSVCQYTSNFFVNQARKSSHTFNYTELNQYIIWNYSPVFTYLDGSNFEQEYWFPPLE
mmetsp:Transcript_34599/g.90608  ORF Transcript_34599/g.90608 Transcript_34599/m.90608 type:complete len:313 (+) Transcript_34599:629-1567(+)|eukprot:CAMPEP_0182917626 /NCGR_PEP_ID=MMETSP0105_2-20130417/1625_1 /TAXON_ID=81532 ORGANISM="Acanthoeca-like sp., Strain 10tr" /NCGR_SAMPLE_ID=MMETSP0105_2 /ASSEMBLY_ACC=CAM_ASM_000205 /LENGTH=312 /DNA_ID=CAMNT_0025054641 /DNA_START=788 /DNA_END=1726 /DNA_ORIENTATION=-